MSTLPSPTLPSALRSSAAPARPARILPKSTGNPLHLLWIAVLPQFILLYLNLHSFWLVWGEMNARQRATAWQVAGLEFVLLALGAGTAWWLHRRRQSLGPAWSSGLLLLSVGYLIWVTSVTSELIPASVETWILPPDTFLFYQFTFFMPAAFFAALLLACTPLPISPAKSIGLSLALLVGVPFLAYGVSHLRLGSFGWPLWIAAAIVFPAALLRLTGTLYTWARRGPIKLAILTAIVALAAPLGGLYLNSHESFPADFQSRGIYVFAVVNGLLLCLPNFRHPAWHRAVWLGQCFCFPFTAYFFLTFLPFLPLALVAVLLFGAGFLMLTPTVLFLLHGERLMDGFWHETRAGYLSSPALWGAAALLAWPTLFTLQALYDRHVLGQALDFAYHRDSRADVKFSGRVSAVVRGLDQLRTRKAGVPLPFLSDYYQWLVFDGLVLPDDKIDHLYRLFAGTAPPAISSGGWTPFQGLVQPRNRRFGSQGTAEAPQWEKVNLTQAVVTPALVEKGSERTKVTLTFGNTANVEGEFVTLLHVPAGVLVSGFQLKIGTVLVPGRIFEKKTALWVYQKIRDTVRRDPGLLFYTGVHTLEMRVYPVPPREERQAEIEFLYPSGLHPTVKIGGRGVTLGTPAPAGLYLTEGKTGAGAVLLGGEATAALPQLARVPYLHFIVEHSAASSASPAEITARLKLIAQQFHEVSECAVTFANFESAPAFPGLKSISALELPTGHFPLPARGGFATEAAIKRAAVWYGEQTSADASWAGRFPLLVVVRLSEVEPVTEGGLPWMAELIPDVDGYLEPTQEVEDFRLHPWVPDGALPGLKAGELRRHPVIVLRSGESTAAARADGGLGALIPLPQRAVGAPLFALQTLPADWQPVASTALPADSAYSRGAEVWLTGREQELNPLAAAQGLTGLIARSRTERILVPASSFIVVENSAQWKMLSEAEKAKLSADQALEFQESTPEPSSALLAASGAAWLLSRRRCRRGI